MNDDFNYTKMTEKLEPQSRIELETYSVRKSCTTRIVLLWPLELQSGVGPETYAIPMRCTTSCATVALKLVGRAGLEPAT